MNDEVIVECDRILLGIVQLGGDRARILVDDQEEDPKKLGLILSIPRSRHVSNFQLTLDFPVEEDTSNCISHRDALIRDFIRTA